MELQQLIRAAASREASDLILVAGAAPAAYIDGRLTPVSDAPLGPAEMDALFERFLSRQQKESLDRDGDVDFACSVENGQRLRVNVHRQRASLAAAIRFIRTGVPAFESLQLPEQLRQLAELPRGLVLVTGPTGSGKSTTLAAMIEHMNERFERHIITLEDPIEYVFTHRRCIIEQREIGDDSPSFAQALRHVVRQKPDVILVGEMRDRETIATALTASETGHLVLGTLHTSSAAQTVERIIDVFDAEHQSQIRIQLAGTLQAVVCQALLPRDDGTGMVPAIELMIMTPAIRRAIRDSETHLIPGMIETGAKLGMRTLDAALAELVSSGCVAYEAARARAGDPDKFDRLAGGSGPAAPTADRPRAVVAGAVWR